MDNLAVVDSDKLRQLETVIEKNIVSFYEVGTALMEIRDSRLYRNTHRTFEEYCRERWGMSKPYANQVIQSSKVFQNIESSSIEAKPTKESQLRSLSNLNPRQQVEAWKEAIDTAPNGIITAKHVEKIVKEKWIVPKNYKMPPPSFGMQFARMAIMDLEKITDDDTEREEAFDHVNNWIKERRK